MNRLLIGFVCVLVIAGFLGGIVATNILDGERIAEAQEIQKLLLGKTSESPTVNVTVEIPNIEVSLDSGTILNEPKKQEIITAKDIGFVVTQLYIDNSILYLRAQSDAVRQKIFLEIIEITDSRDIDKGKFAITTDAGGMISLNNRLTTFRNGYTYKINFFYNENKIAATTSYLVKNGMVAFTPVILMTNQPSQYSVRITDQEYYDMWLSFEGETTVLIGEIIIADIEGIDNNIAISRKIEVNSDGKILISEDEKNIISAGLNEGRYKMILRNGNTKHILCILGFEVVKEKINEDKAVFKGTRWIQNFYTSVMA